MAQVSVKVTGDIEVRCERCGGDIEIKWTTFSILGQSREGMEVKPCESCQNDAIENGKVD